MKDTIKSMTLKQLYAAINHSLTYIKDAEKAQKEFVALRGFRFERYDEEVEYYQKRLAEYREALPEAERIHEEKLLKRIAKEQLKGKASSIQFIKKGDDLRGVTPNGDNWFAIHNWYGATDRTRHCYTLRIAGECIFTSGTLEKVLITVAQR